MNSSATKFRIFLYYYIQNDKFDGLTEPNVYALPTQYSNVNEVKVEHIYNCFPLKHENVYLRFYLDDPKQNLKVWIDLPPSATAPVYKEKVYVKALRMPKEIVLKFKNDDYFSKKKTEPKPKNVDLFASSNDEVSNDAAKFNSANGKSGPVGNNKSNSFEDKNTTKGNDLHNLINGGNTKAESENKKVIQEEKDNDLEFTFHNPNSSDNVTAKPKNNGGLLDGIDFNSMGTSNKTASTNEIFNVSSASAGNKAQNTTTNNIFDTLGEVFAKSSSPNNPPSANQSNKNNSDSSFNLSELNFGATSNVNTNQKANIEPINPVSNNPIDNISEALNEDQMKEKIDQIINNWSFGINEKKNLRLLLATFHEVWTFDPSWRDLSMKDLLEDEKCVSKNYRKAMLQLHPDKNQNKSLKVKYIAECLFQILNKANTELPK